MSLPFSLPLYLLLLALTDKELRVFQETGEVAVNGHILNNEDIHVSYTTSMQTLYCTFTSPLSLCS